MPELDGLVTMHAMTLTEAIFRLIAAAGFAFLLGLDREIRNKTFGLRTHMLLSVGTAAFVLITLEGSHQLRTLPEGIALDPARVIQGIIISIGFLAAGAIVQSKEKVIGATTGAGIWVLGSIGMACGFGLYLLAGMIMAFGLFIVIALHPFNRWLDKGNGENGKNG